MLGIKIDIIIDILFDVLGWMQLWLIHQSLWRHSPVMQLPTCMPQTNVKCS